MHCGGCMRKVEQALLELPGVVSARANLSEKRVAITTGAATLDAEAVLNTLHAAGFEATALAESYRPQKSAADADYLKRLGVAGFAAANIMLLSVAVWSGHANDMPASMQTLFHWLSALIALPAVAYAGQPFFISARRALGAGRLNMDVPISLGVTLATAMSLYQTLRGSEQVYFDAAVTLLFFLLIGRALDQRMRSRTASAAENLLGLRNPMTNVIGTGGAVERIATAEVRPGMRILIAAGERIPVDARLLSARSEIDESLITGESRPRTVETGAVLYAGTVNLTLPIEAEVTAVADNTLLADIARLIETAEQARGRYVRLADRAARLYAPAVHMLGLATFIGWMLAGYGWEPALTAAIAVLIITCPCALALAVPAVQVVATGRLFRSGVVLKAADGLERLAEVDTIVLDKTGTITVGEPRLAVDTPLADAILAKAASLAAHSRHPYARAVVRAAGERGMPASVLTGVEEIVGRGLRAVIEGRECKLGSAEFVGLGGEARAGQTLWFRDGSDPSVGLALTDRMRRDAAEVMTELRRRGYMLEVLSGDRSGAVAEVAQVLSIDDWRGEQRPDDKIRRIAEIEATGRKVLMIGDGLNDAPSLARGHASMSPATAADISQTAADAVFQGEALAPVVETLAVAKAARRRSLENFAIAVGYNILFVPMAVMGLVTPLIAAIAMSGSSLAVTANALRLARRGKKQEDGSKP
jgi:Cu2+-exporting ATPase